MLEESNRKPKDRWDKFGIITTALIPVVIFVVGFAYNRSQQEISRTNVKAQTQREEERKKSEMARDDKNRQADRLTTMIKSLASDSPTERALAYRVAEHLWVNKQLPPEIGSTIIDAIKSPNKDEAKAARSFARTRSGSKDENISIYPVRDGDDVMVPHLLISAIPGFDEKKPVYAANDINGWLVSGKEQGKCRSPATDNHEKGRQPLEGFRDGRKALPSLSVNQY